MNVLLYWLILSLGKSEFIVKAALNKNTANPDETAGFPHGDIISIPNKIQYWPNGLVYYHFNENTSRHDQLLVWKAMEEFHNQTCIRFEENEIKAESIFIQIHKTLGTCYTNLGKTLKDSILVIGKDCLNHGVIIHLLMHCLGFHHENNRPNRDKHVKMNFENVKPGSREAFKILHFLDDDLLPQYYDFDSITHNSAFAYAIDESIPTMTALNSGLSYGQRVGLSFEDVNKLRILYQCKEPYLPQTTTTTASLPLPTPTGTSICAGKHEILIPHPTDCSRFFSCSNNIAIEMKCSVNLVFNPKKQRCDYKHTYDCKTAVKT